MTREPTDLLTDSDIEQRGGTQDGRVGPPCAHDLGGDRKAVRPVADRDGRSRKAGEVGRRHGRAPDVVAVRDRFAGDRVRTQRADRERGRRHVRHQQHVDVVEHFRPPAGVVHPHVLRIEV